MINACILLIAFNIIIFSSLNSYGQDLITLKTGEEIEVKIISKSKGYIKFYEWEDKEKKIHELGGKTIK